LAPAVWQPMILTVVNRVGHGGTCAAKGIGRETEHLLSSALHSLTPAPRMDTDQAVLSGQSLGFSSESPETSGPSTGPGPGGPASRCPESENPETLDRDNTGSEHRRMGVQYPADDRR
jgi:hypothetical protein